MNEAVPSQQGHSPAMSDPENWVDQHGDILFAYALRATGNRAVAEDLVQETLLAAFRGRDSFSGASAERTWIIGILKNKILDHYRRSGREKPMDEPDLLSGRTDPDYIAAGPDAGQWKQDRRPSAWSVDVSDPVEQQQFWQHLQHCLEGMDERSVRAYRLREVQEIDSAEVCNILDVTATNLRVILHRVRKLLRRCMEVNWIGA